MPLPNRHSFNSPFPGPVVAPEFPPPLYRQPPSPGTINRALSTPPFSWNGISLRVFRCPSSLSDFAKFEEHGDFLGPEHKYWYKILKSALERDLQDLKRCHDTETKMEPSLRCLVERQENAEFHEEFMTKLEWGQESSPLLLRPTNYLDTEYIQIKGNEPTENHKVLPDKEFHDSIMNFKKRGLKTEFPSIRTFFRGYPGPSVSWAVQDFYRRQEAARDAAKIRLEFQQMWEWSERHWDFFEATSKLREWVRKEIDKEQRCPTALIQEYDSEALNWSTAIESHKRRHQWAVLKRIMKVYEYRDEKFPEMNAPAGRSFDRYFGKYGRKDGWYPIDKELDCDSSRSLLMQQMDGAESLLEAGGSLAQACAGVVDGCVEGTLRTRIPIVPLPPPQTVEEADTTLVRMRVDADKFLTKLRSNIRNTEVTTVAESTTTAIEELPDPTDDTNGDTKVNTISFLAVLAKKLIGPISGNPESEPPIQGWLTSWRNPRASFYSNYPFNISVNKLLTRGELPVGSMGWWIKGLISTVAKVIPKTSDNWVLGIFGKRKALVPQKSFIKATQPQITTAFVAGEGPEARCTI